jgi:HK97 gp10 family phage protein
MGWDISGADIFLRDLENMIPSDTNVDTALKDGGQILADEMIRAAPVETGKLKAAIKVGEPRNSKRGRTVTVGIHRKDIDLSDKGGEYYPAFVEYGHGGPHPAPPHPFIRPAYDLKSDEAWNTIKQDVIDQMKV